MELNEYQNRAMDTCLPSSNNFSYASHGATEEHGEYDGKIAKMIRKGLMKIDNNELWVLHDDKWRLFSMVSHDPRYVNIIKELSDEAWFLAVRAKVIGWTLEDICQLNLDKLADRKKRGVINSEGDER